MNKILKISFLTTMMSIMAFANTINYEQNIPFELPFKDVELTISTDLNKYLLFDQNYNDKEISKCNLNLNKITCNTNSNFSIIVDIWKNKIYQKSSYFKLNNINENKQITTNIDSTIFKNNKSKVLLVNDTNDKNISKDNSNTEWIDLKSKVELTTKTLLNKSDKLKEPITKEMSSELIVDELLDIIYLEKSNNKQFKLTKNGLKLSKNKYFQVHDFNGKSVNSKKIGNLYKMNSLNNVYFNKTITNESVIIDVYSNKNVKLSNNDIKILDELKYVLSQQYQHDFVFNFKKDNYIGYFIVKKDDLKLPNNGCPIKK